MLAGLLVSWMILSAGSGAQEPETAWQVLKKYDADGNGRITAKEYPRGEVRFLRLDGNGDGVLTEEDLALLGRRRPRMKGGENRRPRPKAPKAGAIAPDFELPLLGAKKPTQVKLSSFRGKKPVALIFGSYT
ncbi:MAG: hypothetical protein DWQ01_10470 [Planctomycetota bacterium]|nr:MAG: hypothetical protein DWQ01_10470 [Planctomycetota bacterium]